MIKQKSTREPVWDGEEDQKNHIVLSRPSDFKRQYDEISHPHLHNITEQKHCWHHKWKNAYLAWIKDNYHVDIGRARLAPDDHESRFAPGTLVRFCLKCKLIDCIHYLGKHKEYEVYEVRRGQKTGFIVVRKCKICGLRIRVWDASALAYYTDEELLRTPAPRGK